MQYVNLGATGLRVSRLEQPYAPHPVLGHG